MRRRGPARSPIQACQPSETSEHRPDTNLLIDYDLRAKLYKHARAEGASHDELAHWFQYPRGRTASLGIPRHARNHADHMHVRFVCDATDPECQMFRVMPINSSLAKK